MAGALLLNKFLDSLFSLFSILITLISLVSSVRSNFKTLCNLIALITLLALIPHSLLLTPVPRLAYGGIEAMARLWSA